MEYLLYEQRSTCAKPAQNAPRGADLKIRRAYLTSPDILRHGDQNVFNTAFQGDINFISERWNGTFPFMHIQYGFYFPHATEFIRHLAGNNKPWGDTAKETCKESPAYAEWFQEYWAYEAITRWKA